MTNNRSSDSGVGQWSTLLLIALVHGVMITTVWLSGMASQGRRALQNMGLQVGMGGGRRWGWGGGR